MNPTPAQHEATRHVLWHFGDYNNGWEPGSFTKALLSAWGRADLHNQARLSEGFPEYGNAMWKAQNEPGGMDELRESVQP